MSGQLPQGNFPFNSGMYFQNSYLSQPPPPIHITRNLYEVNGRIVALGTDHQMTNLNLLTQKWDTVLTMHDTSMNHVGQPNPVQNTISYGSHFSSPHNLSMPHTLKSSNYTKIDENNSVMPRTNLSPQQNTSSTWDNNQYLKVPSLNPLEYPKINEKNPVMSPQSKKSSAANKNVVRKKNSPSATKSTSNYPRIKREPQRSLIYYNNTQSEDVGSIGNKYVSAIKNNLKLETNEFKVSYKDFPELPKAKNCHSTMSLIRDLSQMSLTDEPHTDRMSNEIPNDRSLNDYFQTNRARPKIQMQSNGLMTNIPGSMIPDQYGIIGTLASIRTKKEIPHLAMLSFGEELTELGMDLNSAEDIHPHFGGPFESSPIGPNRNEFNVPPEYIIQHKIKDRLHPIELPILNDMTLFYIFYSGHNDCSQLAAADELFIRGWRFHTELRVWMTNVDGMPQLNRFEGHEEGTYYVFDTLTLRQIPRELRLDCSKLENRSK